MSAWSDEPALLDPLLAFLVERLALRVCQRAMLTVNGAWRAHAKASVLLVRDAGAKLIQAAWRCCKERVQRALYMEVCACECL